MSDDGGGDDEQMSNWRLQNCSCAINKCFYDCIIGTWGYDEIHLKIVEWMTDGENWSKLYLQFLSHCSYL